MHRFIIGLAASIAYGSLAVAANDEGSGVLILGGTRGVGLETVRLLEAADTPVTVLVRPTSDLAELNTTAAQLVVGDALQRADIDKALATGRFHAVVSTLSGKSDDGRWADSTGNINAIDAAGQAGVGRFVLISSLGVGDSKKALPWIVRKILGDRLAGKEEAENHLTAHGIDYTIIRPGQLTNKKPSGFGILSEDRKTTGRISRAEVARLIVETIDDPAAAGKTYAAVEKK